MILCVLLMHIYIYISNQTPVSPSSNRQGGHQSPSLRLRVLHYPPTDLVRLFLRLQRVPSQDVPNDLILWYVTKIVYLSQKQDQFSVKSSNLFIDLIALIVRMFIVRYTKQVAASNTAIGSLRKFWGDPHVDMYSKSMFFRAIPCNLLLWGCKSWALRQSLLNTLDVFLHRNIRRILGINITKVIYMRINNTSIRIMSYNIPCIRNQVAFRQLSYVDKIFWRKESHIPTHLLTAQSNHPRKHDQPLLTNNISLARNL